MWTMFKNLVKDYFKAHSSIHFSQMNASRRDDDELFEDSLLSDDDMNKTLSVNWEYDAIMCAIEKLE